MIRFFISSTFKDMQVERDVIHKSVYPVIRQYGLEKGVSVDICDLRWGIDYDAGWSEEESIAEVMNVCFAEIRDCKPDIVAIIGNHYGTVLPIKDKMLELWERFGKKKSSFSAGHDISLTQWELEYSFLSDATPNVKSLCLFRCGNEAPQTETAQLRKRIEKKAESSNGGIVCEEYNDRDIDEFATKLIQYAKKRIDEESYELSTDNWVDRELKHAGTISEYREKEFSGRREYLRCFDSFIASEKQRVLGFYGQSGIGKSSLMAKLFLSSPQGYSSKMIACGISEKSKTYLNVLIEIIYILECQIPGERRAVCDDLFTEDAAEKRLKATLMKYPEVESKILIFVDAMDKLVFAGKNRLIQLFSECSPRGIKLICSQITPYGESDLKMIFREVTPISENDIREILNKKLFDQHQKRVSEINPIVEAIVKKSSASSPLYLKAVITILKMYMSDRGASRKKRNDFFVSVINGLPDKIEDVCWAAIKQAIDFVFGTERSMDKHRKMMKESIALIAFSRCGLRECDLERTMKNRAWSATKFSSARLFLAEFFRQQEDGRWTFEHDIITEGVKRYCRRTKGGEERIHKILYDYVFSEECTDLEIKVMEGLYLSYSSDREEKYKRTIEILREVGEIDMERQSLISEYAAKELEAILHEDTELIWFTRIVQEDLTVVIRALTKILEMRGREDYARRIPAKYVVNQFWKILSIHGREDMDNWSKQENRTFEEQFLMASLCTEYVCVVGNSGDRITSLGYSFFPKEFYLQNFARMSSDQAQLAYKYLGSLFCTNNAVLSTLYLYSNEVKSFIENAPKDIKEAEREVEYGLLRNMGQYYSAIGDLSTSLTYRMQFLGEDIDTLFSLLGEKYTSYRKAFTVLCDTRAHAPFHISEMGYLKHNEIWESIINQIVRTHYSKQKRSEIAKYLKVVAMGYFVICYDINKMQKDVPNYSELIVAGCNSIEVSILIFRSELVSDLREECSSYIRGVQIHVKNPSLSPDKLRMVVQDWGTSGIDAFEKYIAFLGQNDAKKLLEGLEKYQSAIQSVFTNEEQIEYQKQMKRLRSILYGER